MCGLLFCSTCAWNNRPVNHHCLSCGTRNKNYKVDSDRRGSAPCDQRRHPRNLRISAQTVWCMPPSISWQRSLSEGLEKWCERCSCRQSLEGQSLACYGVHEAIQTLRGVPADVALIQPEGKLIDVAAHVLAVGVVIDTVHTALHNCPH